MPPNKFTIAQPTALIKTQHLLNDIAICIAVWSLNAIQILLNIRPSVFAKGMGINYCARAN